MGSRELSEDYSGKYPHLLMCGIYKIVNTVNRKYYVGSAKVVYDRWIRHISELRKGTHNNAHLQRAWNKYGEANFTITIVEQCSPESLLDREQYYLDLWKPYEPTIGYNICSKASGGDNLSNNPRKEEIVEKISKGMKKHIESLSAEERLARFQRFGEQNSNFGNKWSDAAKEHLSKLKSGIPLSAEHANAAWEGYMKRYNEIWSEENRTVVSERVSGTGNPFYGKEHSAETKEILAAKANDRYSRIDKNKLSKQADACKKEVVAGGITFESLTAAAKHYNITVTAIYNKIKAKKEGYHYVNDTVGEKKGKRKVMVEGVEYESLDQAVEKSGVSRKTIKKRANSGKDGYKFL